jgi:hypothetical protein
MQAADTVGRRGITADNSKTEAPLRIQLLTAANTRLYRARCPGGVTAEQRVGAA